MYAVPLRLLPTRMMQASSAEVYKLPVAACHCGDRRFW
jgi:hypothetical protein